MSEILDTVNTVWGLISIPITLATMFAAFSVPYHIKKSYNKQRFYEKRKEHHDAIQGFISRLQKAPDPDVDLSAFTKSLKQLHVEIIAEVNTLSGYDVWRRKQKKRLSQFVSSIGDEEECCIRRGLLTIELKKICDMISAIPPIMT